MLIVSRLRSCINCGKVSRRWNSNSVEQVVEAVVTPVSVIPEPAALHYPVWAYQTLMDTAQVATGAPWWVVLIGTGLLTRSLLLPFNVTFEKAFLKSMPATRKLQEYDLEYQKLYRKGDHIGALVKRKEIKLYKKQIKYRSPLWYLIPSVSLVILNFTSIRGLSNLPYFPLQETSFLWCSSLTAADPFLILPFLNSALTVYVIKYGIDTGTNPFIEKLLSSPFAVWIAFTIMLGCQSLFPSCLVIYWLTSNVIGTAVIGPALKNDMFRTKVGLPTMAEKKERTSQMITVEEFTKNNRDAYNIVREEGHKKGVKDRRKRLRELEEEKKTRDENVQKLSEDLQHELEELEQVKEKLKTDVEDYEKRFLSVLGVSKEMEKNKSEKLSE